jgi:hypothetical protein
MICCRRTGEKQNFGRREKHFILEWGGGKLQNFVRGLQVCAAVLLMGRSLEIQISEL